jgi:hypothetical protein
MDQKRNISAQFPKAAGSSYHKRVGRAPSFLKSLWVEGGIPSVHIRKVWPDWDEIRDRDWTRAQSARVVGIGTYRQNLNSSPILGIGTYRQNLNSSPICPLGNRALLCI